MPRNLFLYLLIFLTTCYLLPPSVKAQTPINQCLGITLDPPQSIYLPNTPITVSVQAQGDVSQVILHWDYASRNLIRHKTSPWIGSPAGSLILERSSGDATRWSGLWTTPAQNSEYILYADIQSNTGLFCTGNPGFSCPGCETGALDNTNQPATLPTQACQGCHTKIIVKDQINDGSLPYDFDLKNYWNFNPGNNYLYQGESKNCWVQDPNYLNDPSKGNVVSPCPSGPVSFQALQSVEEKVNVCGHIFTPWRMVKDHRDGYNHTYSLLNRRIFMSVFEPGERWSQVTLGKPLAHDYLMDPTATIPLANLGIEDPSIAFNRSTSEDGLRFFENNYFAPHLFTERYVQDGWSFSTLDKLSYSPNITNPFEICNWPYNATDHERYVHNSIHYESSINSPAYQGPGVRLRLIECGSEDCKFGSWGVREDWYFAQNIGRVKLDQKRLDNGACDGIDTDDPDCYNLEKMSNPDLTMSLVNYYAGGPLSVSILTPTITTKGILQIEVRNQAGVPYTGWLESKTCISETPCEPNLQFKWRGWVKNGLGTVDYTQVPDTINPGLRHSLFRPWVETAPPNTPGETVVAKTELPWSNEIQFRVTISSDLDNDQDTDFLDLLSFLTRPFTTTSIFDYNKLVGAL